MKKEPGGGFTMMPNEIIRAPKWKLTMYEKALLYVVTSWKGVGDYRPEIETLADHSGMSRSKAFLVIKSLREKGYITTRKNKGSKLITLKPTLRVTNSKKWKEQEALKEASQVHGVDSNDDSQVHGMDSNDDSQVHGMDSNDDSQVHGVDSNDDSQVHGMDSNDDSQVHGMDSNDPRYGLETVHEVDSLKKRFFKETKEKFERVEIPLFIEVDGEDISREDFKSEFDKNLEAENDNRLTYLFNQAKDRRDSRKKSGARF